jgi:hypothetical protein
MLLAVKAKRSILINSASSDSIRVRQVGLDELASLQIAARNDKVGEFHFFDPGDRAAGILALIERFATGTLFETAFAFSFPAITPSRFLIAR